jgi:DNA adenine methylase
VKEFDGPDTFFYLDPPYPGHNVEIGEDTFDEVEFRKVLDGIKGKFLVTYGTRGELDTKGFHVRKIRPPRSIRAMRGVGGPKTLPTLLIANYAITEKSLGTGELRWELEPVDGFLELDTNLAVDLEHARSLAKALAESPSRAPEVAALAQVLAAVEPAAGPPEGEIALDLLEVANRLSPVLEEQAPGVAKAFSAAAPVLTSLSEAVKAEWTRAFINDLPDSAFLYIEPGGEKDEQGKTVPRSLRRFPVRNHLGRLDVPHLRNALARISQAEAQGLTDDKKLKLQEEARRLLEEAQKAEDVEKAKRVPFNQWGGSAKYAKKLAERLPDHDRYVEPFCGSAALFFAKEPADEEVLADADPDVVFAHRFIQRLDKGSFAALERFPWKVSRTGFKRARECEPRSDAERFWKLAYGRQCAWGGKSNMSGFSTIHEGQTYDIEELWRFQERLKGARLVTKDWKETLAECDGAGTLFFIDPPYVEEWDMENGIPPEDIATEVAKLKGDYVIAYTDSARARRALRKVGRPFKMRFLEARHAGLWKTRSRLFVASCKLKKIDDVEWIDEPEAGVADEPAMAKVLEVALSRPIPLLKTDEERYVLGIVLEPETVDAQKDIYSAAEIREAAHRFMEEYRNVGLMHRELVNQRVKILESYLAPAPFELDSTRVKKGTWLLAVRVVDDDLWRQVKAGDLAGFSIGGSAVKVPVRA